MRAESFLLENPIFTTRDFAYAVNVSLPAASRFLGSWKVAGLIQKVTRSIWANSKHPQFSRHALIPFLLGKEQGYESFLSALERRGVISQIPSVIFIATTGHSRKLKSILGTFEFFQIKPQYMREGIEWQVGKAPHALATAEKALLDCLYISTRKGNRFGKFPEIEFERLKKSQFLNLLNQHKFSQPFEYAIRNKFKALYKAGQANHFVGT